jgi:hypothetical protein
MGTMPIYRHRLEASWSRCYPSPRADDVADLDEAHAAPPARRGRQIAVKVLGWACIAGFSALSGWMATSTAAHDAIASWATMGNVQPRLAVTSLESTQREELVPAVPPVVAPVPAEPPASRVAATEPSIPAPEPSVAPAAAPPAPKLRAAVPAHRDAWRKKVEATDDPYADATPPAQPSAANDPYDEKAQGVPYYQPSDL